MIKNSWTLPRSAILIDCDQISMKLITMIEYLKLNFAEISNFDRLQPDLDEIGSYGRQCSNFDKLDGKWPNTNKITTCDRICLNFKKCYHKVPHHKSPYHKSPYHKSPYHKSPYHHPTQFCVQFWSVFGVPDHLLSIEWNKMKAIIFTKFLMCIN